MKTQTVFQNSSLVSVVDGRIAVKDANERIHTFIDASVVSVNNGTIIIESEWKPKNGELIKYTWDGTRYCIFREIIANQLWSYGGSVGKLSEFPYDCDVPKCRPYSKNLNISPVTPKEQKEFDDFCKSQGKIWNKEKLQWEKYRWKPAIETSYFYVFIAGGTMTVDRYTWNNDETDNNLYDAGNCFKTKEEAETKLKQIKKLLLEV